MCIRDRLHSARCEWTAAASVRALGLGHPHEQAAHGVPPVERGHQSAHLLAVPDVAALELGQGDAADVDLVEEYVDIIQIGARNVQNFALLKKVGKAKKPVLLKRGMMTTIEEFLMSAEYILSSGNDEVILCERGIRTFETATRNTLDISAVPVVQATSHGNGIRM